MVSVVVEPIVEMSSRDLWAQRTNERQRTSKVGAHTVYTTYVVEHSSFVVVVVGIVVVVVVRRRCFSAVVGCRRRRRRRRRRRCCRVGGGYGYQCPFDSVA